MQFFNIKIVKMAVQKDRKVYVLSLNCEILGVWTNLKHLCIDMLNTGVQFSSYSKLSKELSEQRKQDIEKNVLEVSTKDGKLYKILVEVIK